MSQIIVNGKLFSFLSPERQEDYDLHDPKWEVHTLTGTFKLFFRELKQPLIPEQFFDKMKYFRDQNLRDRSKSSPFSLITIFLDASLHLYKRVCPSVGRSVMHFFIAKMKVMSVGRSVYLRIKLKRIGRNDASIS